MMREATVSWVDHELRYVQLGDARLNRRLINLVGALADQPAGSMREACGDWAATRGAYRFWASERVSADAIQEGHRRSTVERLRGQGNSLSGCSAGTIRRRAPPP